MEKTKIEVTKEELDLLKKFNEDKRKALLAQLAEVDSKLEQYGGTSKQNKLQVKLPFRNSFPTNGKQVEKALYVINDLNRFSTIKDITSRFAEFDPSVIVDGKIPRPFYKALTRAVLHMCDAGGPLIKLDGEKHQIYGKKDWLNDNGSIKDEHR